MRHSKEKTQNMASLLVRLVASDVNVLQPEASWGSVHFAQWIACCQMDPPNYLWAGLYDRMGSCWKRQTIVPWAWDLWWHRATICSFTSWSFSLSTSLSWQSVLSWWCWCSGWYDTPNLMSSFSIPHHAVAQVDFGGSLSTIFQSLHNFASRTDVDPLSSLAVCISSPQCPIAKYRITDQWQNPIPPDMRQETGQQEPDPDVIPDPVHAPPFIHDLLELAERHGAFTDLDAEDVFRVRTWYIHHVHQQRNLEYRILEFHEDWRRWDPDLRGAWRDHIRPDEEVDFNVAFPDPYRGSLPQPTHADIILSQGTWIHRLPGIVTTHYSGSSAQQFSFAVAASFGPTI